MWLTAVRAITKKHEVFRNVTNFVNISFLSLFLSSILVSLETTADRVRKVSRRILQSSADCYGMRLVAFRFAIRFLNVGTDI